MNRLDELKETACSLADSLSDWAAAVSREIFTHPEYSDLEYYSSQFLVDEMKKMGFQAEYPYMGLDTAFSCSMAVPGKVPGEVPGEVSGDVSGEGRKVAFLAEYDALPGYGPDHNEMAHACGHNWIAAASALAAVITARVLDVPGEVRLIGTPGEEETGRKVDLSRAGAFDGLDGVFEYHLMQETCIDPKALAMTDFVFEFTGKAAHAAKCPEEGVSALDACQLTIAGINALRQLLPAEVKIHVTYIDGGGRASVIPEHASLSIYIRDAYKDRLETIITRIIDIGRGAELMTGAKFSYTRAENTYYDLRQDRQLQKAMKKNLALLGVTDLTKGDVYHAASSDIGNVSYCCPTCYCYMGMSHLSGADVHADEFIEVADSEGAHQLLLTAAKAMAMTALDVLYDNKDA